MSETCGECKYFRLFKDTSEVMALSDGECLNRRITKKGKDYDEDACNLFEKKIRKETK